MNRKGIVGAIIAVPVLVVAGFALFLLGQAGKLPGQHDPTAIPVTPFANIGATSAGTTIAATTAPTIAPTTGSIAASTAAVPGTSAASSAPTTSTTAAGTVSSGAAANAPTGATTYAIVGDTSQAKVTVNEKLAQLPSPSDAVLTTNAVQGQLFLGADMKPVEGAKIMVDLRTLKSDESRRDNFIKQSTLQTAQFPLAEYVITGVDGWTGPLAEGRQSSFKLLGNMTIHGVTKPVIFDTTATMQSGNVTGTATTTFKFQDFGMTPPSVAIARATDTIKLDVNIVASKAA